MDAIAGGGGIITVPTYLIAFSRLPAYYALGTNKLSSGIGTVFSTARFIKNGLVDWKLFTPAVALALAGSVAGTWLQHHTPDVVLKYLLLFVLPVVAFVTLRNRSWRTSLKRWSSVSGRPLSGQPPFSSADTTDTTVPAPEHF